MFDVWIGDIELIKAVLVLTTFLLLHMAVTCIILPRFAENVDYLTICF